MYLLKKVNGNLHSHVVTYPVPVNINYFFGFGFLAMVSLVMQILTGVFLSMHYTAHVSHAFFSVEHIMRDVNSGWFLRLLHANGASFFFIVLYIHIAKGLFYESFSYPRNHLWMSGIVIFLLTMATAFMGYVLPWGQMSFWGATVIINLFTAIPIVGEDIATFLWGGFSVANPTLNRFFSLHYLLPFVILGLVIVHLGLLHAVGSTNVLNSAKSVNNIFFYPYFFVKDFVGFFAFFTILFFFVFFEPNYLGHPDNFIEANPMVTPLHIVPEWYFLPFYAILRSIPDKLGGVIFMFASILILFVYTLISFMGSNSQTGAIIMSKYRCTYKAGLFLFFLVVCFLGWLGSRTVDAPYVYHGQLCTFLYFFYFFYLLYIRNEELVVYYSLLAARVPQHFLGSSNVSTASFNISAGSRSADVLASFVSKLNNVWSNVLTNNVTFGVAGSSDVSGVRSVNTRLPIYLQKLGAADATVLSSYTPNQSGGLIRNTNLFGTQTKKLGSFGLKFSSTAVGRSLGK